MRQSKATSGRWRLLLGLLTLLYLAGCGGKGSSLDGTWKSEDGKVVLDFVPPNSLIWRETEKRSWKRGEEEPEEEVEVETALLQMDAYRGIDWALFKDPSSK